MEQPAETQTQVTVQFTVSFEALQNAIAKLDLETKCDLLEWLQLLVVDEEAALETDEDRADIAEAIADYEAGRYLTIDEIIEQRRKQDE
jgi:hypothetical protein